MFADNVAPLGYIILILSQSLILLLNNTSFIVFGLTWYGLWSM